MNISDSSSGQRLQKVLAAAGVASRRACEELIARGKVSVDGQVVTRQGMRVDPESVVIHVDGRRVFFDSALVTVALHKPAGVVCSMHDEEGRPDLSAYTSRYKQRLYHVGRLDQDTEGLLLLTNDGELAHRLAHPSYEVSKTYVALVHGVVSRGTVRDILRGVELDDGPVKPDSFRILGTHSTMSEVELVLHEGRNRVVRRLLKQVGHPVQRLVRTRFGNIGLQGIKPGRMQRLTNVELAELMALVGM